MEGEFECLTEAFTALQRGQATAALQVLEACSGSMTDGYRSEWWRLMALAHSHLGETTQAEAAFQQAAQYAPEGSLQRGGVSLSHGALLGSLNRRRDAIRAYLAARDAFRAAKYDEGLVLASYNLGWSLLQVEQVDEAARVFEEAVLAAERRGGATHRASLHQGRSLVASLRGDQTLAIRQAELGVQISNLLPRVRALYRLGDAWWLAGQDREAREIWTGMVADPVCVGHTHQYARGQLALAILDRDIRSVQVLSESMTGAERVRALVAQAGWAQQQADEHAARTLLSEACALNQPHTLALLEPRWTALYTWGRRAGLPLSTPGQVEAPRTVTVHLRGVLDLHVNGYSVAVPVTPQAAVLAAFLIEHGETSTGQLLDSALGGRSAQVLSRAAARLCLAIGDPDAVVTPSRTGDRWRLAAHWTWTAVERGKGRLLGGLDSPFTRDLEWR